MLSLHPYCNFADIIHCVLQTGNNALHLAAWGGHTDIISILLSKNSDMITHTNNVSKPYSYVIHCTYT